MRLADAEWLRRPGLARALAALAADRGQTRLVGGCVRDGLLGLPVADIDLATRLEPREVIARAEAAGLKTVPTGIAHGTVTVIAAGRPIEVTTLRRDVSTDGRRATIAYTDDWKEDAARRDFTINALSANPVSGEIFDYFGGLGDLEKRRVRFIGEPLVRIAEDHLRILRFFRFHARFGGGAPDPEGLAACAARANDLMALSRERIADELLKLLALPDPGATVRLMERQGIFRPVLPEIGRAGVERLAALVPREREAGVEPHALRRLAALLPADPEVAGSVAARLRLSKKRTKRLVSAAAREAPADKDPGALAYWIGRDEAVDRLLLGDRDLAAVAALDGWERPRFPLSGRDLIAMGLEPGPEVSRTLQAIEREWVASGCRGDAKEIAKRHVKAL
ncbi:MAG: CCA tRNA nucleotidyltransferase [Sphingomonadaceae bacterium]